MLIVDFEYTGLDNSYIKDNEIIQIKGLDLESGKSVIQNFKSKKEVTAGAHIVTGLTKNEGLDCFNADNWRKFLNRFPKKNPKLMGFSVTSDIKMLNKYEVDIYIEDLLDTLRLSPYEKRLAEEGCSLEATYYIVTGKKPEIQNHGNIDELTLIKEIYESVMSITDNGEKLNEFLSVMPFGHCRGMPIEEYIWNYRRAADGYRFNNDDLLASSLNYYTPEDHFDDFGFNH